MTKPVMSIVDGVYDCHECFWDGDNYLDAWRHLTDDHHAIEIITKFDPPDQMREGVVFISQYALDHVARKAAAI